MMPYSPYNPVDGNYLTRRFKDIFPTKDGFLEEIKSSDLNVIEDKYIKILYELLCARYCNSTIASYDETQFKQGVRAIIFMYGPTWVKRLEAQEYLRGLSFDELQIGGKAIYNSAVNPSAAPSTAALEELPYINGQNTTGYKKSKAEAVSTLIMLLETDVTETFLNKFKNLFITIVQPDFPLWYKTTPEEQAIIDGGYDGD